MIGFDKGKGGGYVVEEWELNSTPIGLPQYREI